ncbi:MAG: sugar phosphate isomerase/epimerase [Clostridiales bacterium]|nr:sugar phosphate isomerase/epimerase [Clostridiales bacterium]
MKIGVVSAIFDGFSFEEMIDTVSQLGYKCVEVACWPQGKAERRYAGVSHINVDNMNDAYVAYIRDYCAKKNVEISSLAYYPNNLDGDLAKRSFANEHLKKVILASEKLGVNMVTTFIGRMQDKTVDENLAEVQKVWTPIVEFAKEHNVKIGIENCPMLFWEDQWPGGQNIATTPAIWHELFKILPYDNFGLNYDPSHFIWQMMDYIKPIYEFKDKIFHIHFKDIKIYKDKLDDYGIMAYPLQFMAPKIPGLGDIDWGKFVSALTDIGYDSFACVEVEDRAFEGSREKRIDSVALSKKYLDNYVI